MSTRLRLSILLLAILCVANVAWRVWANWGLITIDAAGQPLSEVVHSIERQGHIHLASNLPADAKITMHVHKVPLLHALDVLSADASANWSVGYFAAADKSAIDAALATFSTGQPVAGWKRFALPQMRGMGLDLGSSDPRQDRWNVHAIAAGALHGYLEQASLALSAQFWAPEEWNPAITNAPASGNIHEVLPKLAKAAHGSSAEIFLLSGQPQFPGAVAASGDNNANRPPPPGAFGPPGGMPSEEVRKAMEDRMTAQINKLPADKRAAALADMEARKKFFAELANLTPEERKAKIQERIEQDMNNSEKAAKFESQMTQRGAMQTADQRNDFYRQALSFRSGN